MKVTCGFFMKNVQKQNKNQNPEMNLKNNPGKGRKFSNLRKRHQKTHRQMSIQNLI